MQIDNQILYKLTNKKVFSQEAHHVVVSDINGNDNSIFILGTYLDIDKYLDMCHKDKIPILGCIGYHIVNNGIYLSDVIEIDIDEFQINSLRISKTSIPVLGYTQSNYSYDFSFIQ